MKLNNNILNFHDPEILLLRENNCLFIYILMSSKLNSGN